MMQKSIKISVVTDWYFFEVPSTYQLFNKSGLQNSLISCLKETFYLAGICTVYDAIKNISFQNCYTLKQQMTLKLLSFE
jgi:hypothetical protein